MDFNVNIYKEFRKKFFEKIGVIGLYLYVLSIMISKSGMNLGLSFMAIGYLYLIKNKKNWVVNYYFKEIKLILFLIIIIPVFSLFSVGGVNSFFISFQKLYRYFGILFIPVFISFSEKKIKFFYLLYFSILVNFIKGFFFYYKNDWKFSLRYMSFGNNLLDDAHMSAMLFFIILSILVFSILERNLILFFISFFILIINVLIILLSQSRGAWLSWIVGLLFFTFVNLFNYRKKILKNKFIFSILAIILGIILISVTKTDYIKNNIYYNRFLSIKKIDEDSPKIRLIMWESAIYNYKKHYILGVGRDNSPKYILKYLTKYKKYDSVKNKYMLNEIAKAGNMHNMYFTSLIEEGVLCFIFIIVLGNLLLKEYIFLKLYKSFDLYYFIILGCLCSTLAFCISGLTENAWRNFWKMNTFILILGIYQNTKYQRINIEVKDEKNKDI